MRFPQYAIVLGAIMLALSQCATTPPGPAEDFALQPGDLLFQDLDCGPLCEAIGAVTEGVHGARFAHVGMVTDASGPVYVIEATSQGGVIETPLEAFLHKSHDAQGNPQVVVGRVRPPHDALIPDAIAAARERLGAPYDPVYILGTGEYYCSELVHEAFRDANGGEDVFETEPMTFKAPETDETFPAWEEHYAALGLPIPEGEPGLNPGGMSRAPFVGIVHVYGAPTGWDPPADGASYGAAPR